MAETGPGRSSWPVRARQAAWRAALAIFFTTVLLIPRVRRLRRRVRLWQAMRVVAVLGGAWLVWQFIHQDAGSGALVVGLAFVAVGLLVGPQWEGKAVDEQARELGAVVVLNGGTYIPAGDGNRARDVRIFVHPERLFVLDSRHRSLAEIPLAAVRHLSAGVRTAPGGTGSAWELQIAWEGSGVQTAAFRFEGFFAEHLAQVAETTIRKLLGRELRVLGA